jgi:16S rRNA (cytosine967-C5)-methyltransferase
VTCSILSEENHAVMTAFLTRTPDAREFPVRLTAAQTCPVGAQVLPGESGMDGFYFALVEKT